MRTVAPAPTGIRRVAPAALLAVLTAAVLVVSGVPAHADPVPDAEQRLVSLANAARAERGLDPLDHAGDVRAVARRWSATMAASGELAHNPRYGQEICCWQVVSENVASATGVDPGDPAAAARAVHDGLMGSADHRGNILDPRHLEIGVGVHLDGDVLWVTQNFRRHLDAPAPGETPGDTADPPPGTEPGTPQPSDLPPATEDVPAPADTAPADTAPAVELLDTARSRAVPAGGAHPVFELLRRTIGTGGGASPNRAVLADRVAAATARLPAGGHPVAALMERITR